MTRQLSLADSFAGTTKKRPTEIVDLFCGCGGFSSGAARVPGARVVMAVDNRDQFGRRVLGVHESNHPDAKHYAMRLGPKTEKRLLKRIRKALSPGTHLHLHGSPPCQDWSKARTLGQDQGRCELTTWFVSFAKRLPRNFPNRKVTVSMENVVPARRCPAIRHDVNKAVVAADRHGASTTRRRLFWACGWSIHELERFERPGKSVGETLPQLAEEGWTGFQSSQTFNKTIQQMRFLLTDKVMTILCGKTCDWIRLGNKGEVVDKRSPSSKEYAILQGFLPDYFACLPDRKSCFAIRCIGNSVCPDVAESIVRAVRNTV